MSVVEKSVGLIEFRCKFDSSIYIVLNYTVS